MEQLTFRVNDSTEALFAYLYHEIKDRGYEEFPTFTIIPSTAPRILNLAADLFVTVYAQSKIMQTNAGEVLDLDKGKVYQESEGEFTCIQFDLRSLAKKRSRVTASLLFNAALPYFAELVSTIVEGYPETYPDLAPYLATQGIVLLPPIAIQQTPPPKEVKSKKKRKTRRRVAKTTT